MIATFTNRCPVNRVRRMVNLVRDTAGRQLDESALKFTLRQIEKRAEEGEVPEDGAGVLDDEEEEEAS